MVRVPALTAQHIGIAVFLITNDVGIGGEIIAVKHQTQCTVSGPIWQNLNGIDTDSTKIVGVIVLTDFVVCGHHGNHVLVFAFAGTRNTGVVIDDVLNALELFLVGNISTLNIIVCTHIVGALANHISFVTLTTSTAPTTWGSLCRLLFFTLFRLGITIWLGLSRLRLFARGLFISRGLRLGVDRFGNSRFCGLIRLILHFGFLNFGVFHVFVHDLKNSFQSAAGALNGCTSLSIRNPRCIAGADKMGIKRRGITWMPLKRKNIRNVS